MISANVRKQAIQAIAAARHKLDRVNFKQTHLKDLFGENVFNEEVQRQRLPKGVFRALQKTIRQGAPLDPTVADAVASAMKDWAIEKGATHFTHLFQPMTGLTAEKKIEIGVVIVAAVHPAVCVDHHRASMTARLDGVRRQCFARTLVEAAPQGARHRETVAQRRGHHRVLAR